MYSLFVIAKNNLKKKKSDVIVLFLLMVLSTFLLYTSISSFIGITKVMDTAYEQANTADFLCMINTGYEDQIKDILLAQKEVKEYEQNEAIFSVAEYRSSLSETKNNYSFAINAIEDERNINILVGIDTQQVSYDDILLPYYLKSLYAQGDAFYLTLGEQEYRFTVSGFVEDPLFASPLNVSLYNIYISQECFRTILEKDLLLQSNKVTIYKVRLEEGCDSVEFEDRITDILAKELQDISASTQLSINWQAMKGGGSFMSYMGMGLVLIFSILLILVALIIVRFSIRNFMERNLKNIGILQASGYTVRQLRFGSVLEMSIVSFVSAIAGVLLGVLGGGVIGNFQGMILGLRWNQKANPGAAILAIVIIILAVTGVAMTSSRYYKRITVLDALRSGIHTHNFRKNYFPLEKNKLPLGILLAGKEILGEKKKNISILCIIVILSVTTCVGFDLYESFAVNTENLLDLVGTEVGNALISGKNLSGISKEIESWDEVDFILQYFETSLKLTYGSRQCMLPCDVWDNPEMLRHEMVIEGRLPKYENEIIISTKAAKELGASVGDVVYVEGKEGKLDYLVTGIDQKINHMGMKVLLTLDGMKRLNESVEVELLYIYTKEGISYQNIQEKLHQNFSDITILDTEKAMSETISSIRFALILICGVFIVITCLIVMLVEIILIYSKIIKERKNYGISKALGYTTIQLMVQTMMSNIPVVFIGSAIGVLISGFIGEQLALACFAMFGLKKVDLAVSPVWMAVTVVGIMGVAMITSFLAAVRIRKIEPVRMLVEE